jgi:hypothetical protein
MRIDEMREERSHARFSRHRRVIGSGCRKHVGAANVPSPFPSITAIPEASSTACLERAITRAGEHRRRAIVQHDLEKPVTGEIGDLYLIYARHPNGQRGATEAVIATDACTPTA